MKKNLYVIALIALFGSALSGVKAAQQTFWPLNQWPPATWNFASTNDTPTQFTIPGQGTIYARHFHLINLLNWITPPALNASATYSYSTSFLNYEVSVDNAVWFPAQSFGPVTVKLSHTSDSSASRFFDIELLQLSLNGNSPFGPIMIRESPTKQSLGQTTFATTNGGYLISGFINAWFELSTDGGATWVPAGSTAYLELSGTPGVSAILSISNAPVGNVTVNWTTQTNAHYQLLWNSDLASTNWNTLGAVMQGTVSNLSVPDSILGQTQRFYEVQITP